MIRLKQIIKIKGFVNCIKLKLLIFSSGYQRTKNNNFLEVLFSFYCFVKTHLDRFKLLKSFLQIENSKKALKAVINP